MSWAHARIDGREPGEREWRFRSGEGDGGWGARTERGEGRRGNRHRLRGIQNEGDDLVARDDQEFRLRPAEHRCAELAHGAVSGGDDIELAMVVDLVREQRELADEGKGGKRNPQPPPTSQRIPGPVHGEVALVHAPILAWRAGPGKWAWEAHGRIGYAAVMTGISPLYAETYFATRYDADVPCVEMTWRGYHTSADFRARNAEVMDLLVAHRATRLLADIRDFTLIGADDQTWLNDVWLPAAMGVGLRHATLVAPVFYFNKVAVQTVVDRIGLPALEVAYFDTVERARAWLTAI